MKASAVLIGAVLIIPMAFAADVDGVWEGVINVTGNEVPVKWTFKANGNELTGAVSQAGGPEYPIKDGKIEGNNISFLLQIDYQGTMVDVSYTGVVAPKEIKLIGVTMGGSFEYTVKKVEHAIMW